MTNGRSPSAAPILQGVPPLQPAPEGDGRHQAVQRDASRFDSRLGPRARMGTVFHLVCLLATLVGIVALGALLYDVIATGSGRLTWAFLNGFPSRFAARAGMKPALIGSLWTLGLTAVIAFPLGVGTAIWLEEYAPASRLRTIVEANIANLAGVPSIVYGMLGLAVFVRYFAMGRSILAGALTLALLILPVIIIASQEAIKAVPNSIRLGAYALGSTRWEAVRHHVLPLALPGILTGTILALSRAIGEAAPLIVVGALAFVPFVPGSPMDPFTVVPIQVFNWVSRPQAEFRELAAAASIVLLVLLLSMNAVAIVLRNRFSRRNQQ
ncbi:MAG TPA: phosphate ABC transporter permease PstA [Longimicrobiales bacterium]|nr:phosphate ABC transporter permease PstA [Longimicrobiales bacterium]